MEVAPKPQSMLLTRSGSVVVCSCLFTSFAFSNPFVLALVPFASPFMSSLTGSLALSFSGCNCQSGMENVTGGFSGNLDLKKKKPKCKKKLVAIIKERYQTVTYELRSKPFNEIISDLMSVLSARQL